MAMEPFCLNYNVFLVSSLKMRISDSRKENLVVSSRDIMAALFKNRM